MKLLSQLRIPWVARRWHDAELAAKARLLDGCMEARRQDAERHGRLMRARDAQIAALTERLRIAEGRRCDLESLLGGRVIECARLIGDLHKVEEDRDLARSTEEVLRTSIAAQKRKIEELTTERRDARAEAAMWKDEHDKAKAEVEKWKDQHASAERANERLANQIEDLLYDAHEEREGRERELEDILDFIDAARDYVLDRRSETAEFPAETETAA